MLKSLKQTKEVVMPIIKSQMKRLRLSEKQRERNRAVKSSLKTEIKKFEAASQSGEVDEAREVYRNVARSLDKAVSKGVIHKNKAANKKSRMSHVLNEM